MNKSADIIFLFFICCNPISRVTDRIEETHNVLYRQKALLVHTVHNNRVWFVNPAFTRCYYLKGKHYTEKWSPGDTMIIENNLEDFYNLKFRKNCNVLQ